MAEFDRGSLTLFGTRIVSELIGFVSLIYFARTLGATGLGVFFTFQTLASVLGVFTKLGIPGATVKRISQSESASQRGAYLAAALLLLVPPFLLVTAALVVVEPTVVAYADLGVVVPLLVLVLAVRAGARLAVTALRGERRIASSAGIELLGQVARVAVSVGLLLAGFGVLGLIYGLAAGPVSQAVVGYLVLDTRVARPTRADVASLFDFSKYTAGMEVSALAYNWGDTLVLAAFATKAAVGVYETAWKLSVVPLLGAQVVGVALAPSVTRWHEDGDWDRIESAFSEAVTAAVALVIPALVGAFLLGDAIISALYGFGSGGLIFLVLVVGQVPQAVKNVTQNTLFGIDRPAPVFWTNLLTLVGNVAGNLLLVPEYGMLGAATATVVTAGIAAVSQVAVLRRHLRLRVAWDTLGWQVLSATVMGGALVAVRPAVPTDSAVGVVGLVLFAAAVYGGCLLGHAKIRTRVVRAVPWG
ncbi:flippase [Salinirubrum litoreum]|uniref:Flippase n=1 Tax=Salinirubrum litoreum TaxID=1126234 RepID=A0ABD5RDV8_9EURY|nr:flippase [Salinirubrum litoreum]